MAKRNLSPEFLARIGQTPSTVTRGADGKLTSERSRARKDIEADLRKILSRPKYLKNLKARLDGGLAGPLEVYLWRKAYGDPKKDDQDDPARARFDAIREAAALFLREDPDKARIIDSRVTRAPRLLTLPPHLPATPPAQDPDAALHQQLDALERIEKSDDEPV